MSATLDEIRAALAHGDWAGAIALLDAADGALGREELELRAQAAYGAGDLDGCIAAWESAHQLHADAGDSVLAARAAVMVAMHFLVDTGLMTPVRVWSATAQRHLSGAEEGPVHAMLEAVHAYRSLLCGDSESAARHADLAIELGDRHSALPAVVFGSSARMRVRLIDGDLSEGLRLLDELGARLLSGEPDAFTVGMMLCEVICAAQQMALHDLALEWTDSMARWVGASGYGSMSGRCRVHRAELLRLSGPGDTAEHEAVQACRELRPWLRREYGWPLAELGHIRLRRGDLQGAEAALVEAHAHAWSPHPALALLRLAQGRPTEATALIEAALENPWQVPSKERPPTGELCRVPLLEARAEIAAATDDEGACEAAATALARIAADYPTKGLAAAAALARARAALVTGRHHDAYAAACAAAGSYVELGAGYDAAVARLLAGRALAAAGRHQLADLEWTSARSAFEAYGARLRVAEVDAHLQGGPAAPPAPHSRGVFCSVAGMRQVAFGGVSVTVADLTGFRHLQVLLAQPGHEVHVLELVAAGSAESSGHDPGDVGAGRREHQSGLPMIDEQARQAYRRRLAEVDADIEEAEAMNDPHRAELGRRDREFLLAELSTALGLGGRVRRTGGSAERARTSVARSIRYALDRLEPHHPMVSGHLRQAVSTGTWCSYRPDPLAPVVWATAGG